MLGLFILGLSVGILGTILGVGGGILFVPIFIIFYKLPAEIAAGTSLGVLWLNSAAGSFSYYRQKKIIFPIAFRYIFPALPGVVLGGYYLQFVSAAVFAKIFGLICLLIAASLWLKKISLVNQSDPEKPIWQTSLAGFGVGFASSFLGVGGGIIQVPLFHLWHKLPTKIAAATSQFVLFCTVLVALSTHLYFGHLLWPVIFACGSGAVLGGLAGAKLSQKVPEKFITIGLSILLLVVATKLFLH